MKFIKIILISFLVAVAVQAQTREYDPFRHADQAMTVLTGWSVGSIAVGTGMLFMPNTQVQYAGIQNIAWGAIDLGIAVWGKKSTQKNIGYKPPEQQRQEFQKALWINGLLDVAYIGVGYYLYKHGKNDKLKGTGAGIVAQGGFLFVFDWVNFLKTL
ncbi:hypothetical protein EH223_10805 [candidate division KSB1 bacterium]|nr:hypothetical protein [candidate division KSB1 bacterium]RQW03110.1 MAG: hypothetical protein EH223_10805 [candidate division KSB1 bacterium]